MPTLVVQTDAHRQVVDITERVNDLLRREGFERGLCHLFVTHTTAALSTADLDPGTDLDMLDAFAHIVPMLRYRHPHDPSHAPDHILATLLGPSLSAPVEGGRLVLGTWQRVVLFEFDGPRQRRIMVTLLGA